MDMVIRSQTIQRGNVLPGRLGVIQAGKEEATDDELHRVGSLSLRRLGSLSRQDHENVYPRSVQNLQSQNRVDNVPAQYREPQNYEFTPEKAMGKPQMYLDPTELVMSQANTLGYQSSATYGLPVNSPFVDVNDSLDLSHQDLNSRAQASQNNRY